MSANQHGVALVSEARDTDPPRFVTALTPDPRAPGYLLVEVDGARFASLPVDGVQELGLRVGDSLAPADWSRLTDVADMEAAYRVAVRLLAVRPRATKEMLRRLQERGHRTEVSRAAVARLESRGLLDDAQFARHFARVRSARGHGPWRLVRDLQVRGVADEVAQQAVDETLAAEGVDPIAQARALAVRRGSMLQHLPTEAKRRRLLAYLARRGFVGHEIHQVVSDVLAGCR